MSDLLPVHTAEEIAALEESLSRFGVLSPIVMDENGEVIDGRRRVALCEAADIDWKASVRVVSGLSQTQKEALRVKLNLSWRKTPLNNKQKKALARVLLAGYPDLSNPALAKLTGYSQVSIFNLRKQMVKAGEIPDMGESVGTDGKTRKKPKSKKARAKNLAKVLAIPGVVGQTVSQSGLLLTRIVEDLRVNRDAIVSAIREEPQAAKRFRLLMSVVNDIGSASGLNDE